MAVLRKRGKNYFIDYRVNEKRIRKSVGRNKKIAELALKDIEVKLATNVIKVAPKRINIDDFWKEYKNSSIKKLSPRSYERYLEVISHLNNFLDEYPKVKYLYQISNTIIDKYQSARIGKVSNSTINFELMILRSIFNFAIKEKYIDSNPTADIVKLKRTNVNHVEFLSGEEISIILNECNSNKKFGYLYPVLFTLLHTGLRLGEIVHLELTDIDLKIRVINIQNKGYWHTKSYKPRMIPINDELYKVLKPYLTKRKKMEVSHRFIFLDQEGNKFDRHLRDKFMRLTKSCGLSHITRLHILRHTFASHLVMNGIDIPTVQKLLGHSDIKTTMIYSHLSRDHLISAMNKLNYDLAKE